MKKRLHFAYLLPASILLLALMLFLSVNCFAIEYELDGRLLRVNDIAPGTEKIVAAVYDGHGRFSNQHTVNVASDNTAEIELLPDETDGYVKVFSVKENLTPTAPSETLPLPVSRLWMAQKTTELWNLNISAFTPIGFDDTSALTDSEMRDISAACKMGFMSGIGNKRFGPKEHLTNAMVAAILHRTLFSPAPVGTASPYTDVPADAWYLDSVIFLYENDVLPKTASFQPNQTATVTDVTEWMNRLATLKKTLYTKGLVSNIRFEERDGLPVLAWDCPMTNGAYFEVFTTPDGETNPRKAFGAGGKKDNSCVLPIGGRTGTFRGIEIRLRPNDERSVLLASAFNPDLTFVCQNGSNTSGAAPTISFSNLQGGGPNDYVAALDGMNGYLVGHVGLTTDPSRGINMGNFDRLNNGSGRFIFGNVTFFNHGYYSVSGGKNYSLSADGKTVTYETVELISWTKIVPSSGEEISNIRFEVQNGLPVLAWDYSGSTDNVNFWVFSTLQGETSPTQVFITGGMGTASPPPPSGRPGTYSGIEVRAVSRNDGTVIASGSNPNLTIVRAIEANPPVSSMPAIQFVRLANGNYKATIENMSGYGVGQVFLRNVSSQEGQRGNFRRLDANGSAEFTFGDGIDQFDQGEYCINGGWDYSISADGKTLSYKMKTVVDWTQCPAV